MGYCFLYMMKITESKLYSRNILMVNIGHLGSTTFLSIFFFQLYFFCTLVSMCLEKVINWEKTCMCLSHYWQFISCYKYYLITKNNLVKGGNVSKWREKWTSVKRYEQVKKTYIEAIDVYTYNITSLTHYDYVLTKLKCSNLWSAYLW